VCFGCSLIVAAASDLLPLEQALASSIPSCAIRFTFGASGMLAEQIARGADYDVFLAANERFVDGLVQSKAVVIDSKVVYATGRIGLYSRKSLDWSDLRSARNIAIANPQHAPYGLAAKQALEHGHLWQDLQKKVVFGENVRQALRFAETGNADAAIVAWSLVKEKGARLIPAEWHQPIVQSGAIPKQSRNPRIARQFLNFLLSVDGQRLLTRYGFSPAPPTPQTRPASPAR
jgi:molybdate transport system substrate-binding protein